MQEFINKSGRNLQCRHSADSMETHSHACSNLWSLSSM